MNKKVQEVDEVKTQDGDAKGGAEAENKVREKDNESEGSTEEGVAVADDVKDEIEEGEEGEETDDVDFEVDEADQSLGKFH